MMGGTEVAGGLATVYLGDCRAVLRGLPEASVHTCVTSPPYWGLRDYGHPGQLGLEDEYTAYVEALVGVFAEVWRVLRPDGTLWLNLGDTYNNFRSSQVAQTTHRGKGHDKPLERQRGCALLKEKDLAGIPWRVAFALQAAGWWLRQDIVWHKPNPTPESVKDRCTRAHEYIFLLTRSQRYYYDYEAIKEPATYAGQARGGSTNRYEQNEAGMDGKTYDDRNKRDVWTVQVGTKHEKHHATYPVELIDPCILAGAPAGGTVLDPFTGTATTGVAALRRGRRFVGAELNPEYHATAVRRLARCARATSSGFFTFTAPGRAVPNRPTQTQGLLQ